MKRTSRVLAILLALAMLFSVTAFAANTSWPIYGGDLNHTSNVSGAPTSITKEISVALTGGSGWDGIDNVPVMQTVGNKTYALGGMACANGIIVFGNDYNELFVVK